MQETLSSKDLYKQICLALGPAIRQEKECETVAQWLLEHYFQLNSVHRVLDTPLLLESAKVQLLNKALQRLKNHEPVQYVLGTAPFLGRDFQVNPSVLIPRPETEAMVQEIINDHLAANAHVLDLGTGSGCIAITLQLNLAQAKVWGLDIDLAALQIAQANAQRLGAQVQWLQADLLNESLPPQLWDIIVSNPPYVRLSERARMARNVLDYEPARALFVPDEQPLIFYERIVALAPHYLTPRGKLYLEINEMFGQEVTNLLCQAGFEKVSIRQDLHGKDRWVVGSSKV